MKARVNSTYITVFGRGIYPHANTVSWFENTGVPLDTIIVFSSNPLKNGKALKASPDNFNPGFYKYGTRSKNFILCGTKLRVIFGKVPKIIYFRIASKQ